MEKFAENWKTFKKFGVSRQILEKIGAQLCENLYYLKVKDILISFYVLYFMRKYCLVLTKVMLFLKFTISGFGLVAPWCSGVVVQLSLN